MKTYGDVDSKFRFVHVASKRAKMLLRGAKPKIKTKSRNPIRVAQTEVKEGVIDFEIIKPLKEDLPEPEDRIILGGAGVEEADESADDAAGGAEDIVDEEEAEAELSVEFDVDSSDESGHEDK